MKFKILSLLLILGLLVNVGCSSSSDEGSDVEMADAESAEFLEEGEEFVDSELGEGDTLVEGEEFVEEEALEGEEFVADPAAPMDDFATDEEVVADSDMAFEEAPIADTPAPVEGEELADTSLESAPVEESVFEETPMDDGAAVADTSYSDSSYEDTSYSDSSYSDSSTTADAGYDSGYAEAPKYVPVKKIAAAPYTKNGVLVNAVYLARPGDDLASISQKIWGTDNTSAILNVNPNLANSVKVGDKVYYNSPKRPQDSSTLLTYYEDNGIPAQTYTSQPGDNIRVVSKNLLGDAASWKEVWATNFEVESKAEIAGGIQLRYWPDGAVAAPSLPTMAETAPEPVAPPIEEAPMMPEPTSDVAMNDPSAMPQDDFALPDDMATAGTTAAVEPPPPPPPPAPAQKTVASNDEKDLTFMLSAGGLLLVGVGVLLGIIRKGRARKMSMNTHTQI